MNRRSMLTTDACFLLLPAAAGADEGSAVILDFVKDPSCGCCEEHAAYLQ